MPKQAKLQPHPLAELFPLPSPADLRKLADDIREHGLREPIVRLDGKILDGRSRYAACQIAEVELLPGDFVDFTDLDGGDPLAFVLTKNLHRRHLSQSQRGMVAERLATMKQGKPGKHATLQVRRKSAATALGVSERTVADAHTVRKHGTSTSAKAVEADRVPVHTAAKLAREPVETQRKVVDNLPRDTAEARKAAREIPRQIQDARPDDAPAFNLFRVWFVIGKRRYSSRTRPRPSGQGVQASGLDAKRGPTVHRQHAPNIGRPRRGRNCQARGVEDALMAIDKHKPSPAKGHAGRRVRPGD